MKDANIPTTRSSSATKNNPVFCSLNVQSLNNKSDAKNSNDLYKTCRRKHSVVKLPEALPQISSNIVRTKPCIANKAGSQELNLTVATINCESSSKKADNIADYILEQDLDICCLTETWLNSDDTVTIGELCPNGYEIISVPRKDRRGGGVAVIIKQSLSIKFNCSKDTTFRSFEHLNSIVSHPKHSQPLNLTIVYRPPRSNKNTLPISVFFDEISDLFAAYTITTNQLLITGDFNIHVYNICLVLTELHWLPVKARIEHKLLTLTFKAVHGQGPSYLSELISRRPTPRPGLRSNHSLLLTVPKITSRADKSTADRAFSWSAPKLWNSLPEELRNCSSVETFKGKLKTFLLKKYF